MVKNRPKPIEHQIIESVLRGIVAVIKFPFRGFSKNKSSASIDRKEVEARWQEIENIKNSGHDHNLAQAIIMADKLLDAMLKAHGAQGQSMGERLKSAEKYFSNQSIYQGAWDGHKLRNQIAHEINHAVDIAEGQQAIEKFKKAIFCLI